jgi:methionyl aminopeptidase
VEGLAVEHGFRGGAGFCRARHWPQRLHEDPQVPNYFDPHDRQVLKTGMVLCIEPMINAGTHEVRMLSDDWTAVTADGKRSAHFEHTIAVTDNGPEILSRSGFGAAKAVAG